MSSINNTSAPVISPPSIVQQRIILLVFVLILSALVWWQNVSDGTNYSVQKFTQSPMPNAVAELDFSNAEASWSALERDSQGNLKIDQLTYSALTDATARLLEQTSQLPQDRMAFLLEKQFGSVASQQIMALVPLLERYRKVEQRWQQEHGGQHPPPYEELFKLQDEVLGEALAAELFSEQRRLAKMMLASQQIQNDDSLTQAEKQQALQDLQKRFQEGAAGE